MLSPADYEGMSEKAVLAGARCFNDADDIVPPQLLGELTSGEAHERELEEQTCRRRDSATRLGA